MTNKMVEIKNERRKSRGNSVTHGIFAGLLLREGFLDESAGDYTRLLSAVRQAVKPTDSFEHLLVENLTIQYLRLTRVYAADWQTAPKLFEMVEEVFEGNYPKAETEWVERANHTLVIRHGPAPDLLIRYETSIERQIGRILDQLEQWRRMRQVDSQSSEGTG
jgi:hypothetical protein